MVVRERIVSLESHRKASSGFTLIEISIVLVIIGLVIGGVLVGQDLIAAATVRSQITQIEKYNTAVNTFRGKYNGFFPGDIPDPYATRFGFATRGSTEGDGNGVLEGGASGTLKNFWESFGETVMFWVDLSTAGLIDGSFSTASSSVTPSANITGTQLGLYFPRAKLGGNTSILVYSNNQINYFSIETLVTVATSGQVNPILPSSSTATIPVNQAYAIDKKIDDGKALTGNVTTVMDADLSGYMLSPSANPDTSSSCYNSSTGAYSTSVSKGNGNNCALSFAFQ